MRHRPQRRNHFFELRTACHVPPCVSYSEAWESGRVRLQHPEEQKLAYLECLKRYNATVNLRRGQAFFSAPTATLGVRALFGTVLDCLDDPKTPSRVCLMAGSITPEVLNEPELREYVQMQMVMLNERITARLAADKNAGLLPAEFDSQLVAPVIVTCLQGLWRMALISYDRARFEWQIDLFLTGLEL